MDDDLVNWVNDRCLDTFGFAESSFADFFINLGECVLGFRSELSDVSLSEEFRQRHRPIHTIA